MDCCMSSGQDGPSPQVKLIPDNPVLAGSRDEVKGRKNSKSRQPCCRNSSRTSSHVNSRSSSSISSSGHLSRLRALTNTSRDSGVSLNSSIDRFDADRNNHRVDNGSKTHTNVINGNSTVANGRTNTKINGKDVKNSHNADNFHDDIQKDINNGKTTSYSFSDLTTSNGGKHSRFQTIDETFACDANKSNNSFTPVGSSVDKAKTPCHSPKFAFGDSWADEEEEEEDDEKGDEVKVKGAPGVPWSPPDGGFGWMVVFSSFTISMLVDGVCFSFGLFVEDFKTFFNASNSTVSWIGSVLNGTYMFVGPLVSALCNVYGCRPVAFAGAIISSAAIFASTFCTNVIALVLTFGLAGGFGFGMMYLPAIVMVGYYFQKRRALATGIACCGSGIGAFLFAPLSQFLLEEYGWKGALMILSGVVFNGCMFTLFYRPLRTSQPDRISDTTNRHTKEPPSRKEENVHLIGRNKAENHDGLKGDVFMPNTNNLDLKTRKKAKSSTELLTLFAKSPQCPSKEYHGRETHHCVDIVRLAASWDFSRSSASPRSHTSWFSSDSSIMKPLERKDIFYSGSLSKLPDEFSMKSERLSPSQISLAKETRKKERKQNKWSKAFRSIFDVKLLKSPTFIIYGLSCFLCMMGFFVPFIYLPTYAMQIGVDKTSAAVLISIIGFTNIVGRVAVGFISDMPWADCLVINNLALMIGGVATAGVPFFSNYWMFCLYCGVFGSSIAVFVSLRSIIMVELMGLEKLTTAFGFVVMCQGASSFIGAPIAGAVSDITGSYDYAFYMAGGIFLLAGAICLPLRRIARWEGLLQEAELAVKTPNTKSR